jgi:hypothetical protein
MPFLSYTGMWSHISIDPLFHKLSMEKTWIEPYQTEPDPDPRGFWERPFS